MVASLMLPCTVAPAQQSASIGGPSFVKAGENVTFTVNIDPPPSFEGASLGLNVLPPPKAGGGFSLGVELHPNQTGYKVTFRIPNAAPGGTWTVTTIFLSGGGAQVPLKGKEFSFEVIPNQGLVFPTSAEVGISESQGQILRRGAIQLQSIVQDLKGRIREAGDDPKLSSILTSNLVDREAALTRTESEFSSVAPSDNQHQQSQIFFADIRAQYDDELNALRSLRNRKHQSAAFAPTSLELDPQRIASGFPSVAQGTLRALEHNELAYTTVADAESLTFDLEVESHPSEATVSYKRHGDEFKTAPEKTKTTLKSLPYAIWVVRAEAGGLRPQEREYDPFTEPNKVIHFDLNP
jgi:hypothetical protein